MNDDKKPLGLADAVGLIVGIIIGAGIFKSPPDVFAAVSSPTQGIALWLAGAVVALCGALCYAELAAAYPTDSGEAEYLTRAFGPFAGWYFSWVQLVCIRTAAAVVSIAYTFAAYAGQLWPWPTWAYAGGAVLALTGVNALGIIPGKTTQNLLAAAKVLALAAVIAAGFQATPSAGPAPEPRSSSLALALVVIMYTYSGWHEAAYIVGGIRSPQRTLPLAMFAGVAIITVVYLGVNLAALTGLGFAGLRGAKAFGVDLLDRAGWDGRWLAAVVVLATLGSINGTILSGSRLFGAVGHRQAGFGWLARGRSRRDAPLVALAVQALLCLAIVAAIELAGSGEEGFERVVAATSPALWLVFLGAGLALITLRRSEPDHVRPYRVPFYPLVPAVYIAACAYMLYQSIDYARTQSGPEMWLTLGLLALGLPYWLWLRYTAAAAPPR